MSNNYTDVMEAITKQTPKQQASGPPPRLLCWVALITEWLEESGSYYGKNACPEWAGNIKIVNWYEWRAQHRDGLSAATRSFGPVMDYDESLPYLPLLAVNWPDTFMVRDSPALNTAELYGYRLSAQRIAWSHPANGPNDNKAFAIMWYAKVRDRLRPRKCSAEPRPDRAYVPVFHRYRMLKVSVLCP